MSIGERIAQRRRQLQQEATAAAAKQATAARARAEQQSAQQREAAEVAALIEKFTLWARQSNIRPERIERRVGHRKYRKFKGWHLSYTPDGTYDSEKARQPMKRLMLFANGTAAWKTDTWSERSATSAEVQTQIVNFVAASSSRVPWPE